jgi:hypothetical protein
VGRGIHDDDSFQFAPDRKTKMAKKRSGKSRSQHVREYLSGKPDATPKEIVAALAARGVKLSVGLASNVKYTSGPGAKRGKRTVRKRKPRKAAASSGVTIQELVEAKKLADSLGGIDAARSALDALATLQK